ncbi:hypothetical protein NXS19_011466 [Fusarium pseudograminearum]|nr:hypothetical protein NXS19_011466 [Fusarium pseudograminearum]
MHDMGSHPTSSQQLITRAISAFTKYQAPSGHDPRPTTTLPHKIYKEPHWALRISLGSDLVAEGNKKRFTASNFLTSHSLLPSHAVVCSSIDTLPLKCTRPLSD